MNVISEHMLNMYDIDALKRAFREIDCLPEVEQGNRCLCVNTFSPLSIIRSLCLLGVTSHWDFGAFSIENHYIFSDVKGWRAGRTIDAAHGVDLYIIFIHDKVFETMHIVG